MGTEVMPSEVVWALAEVMPSEVCVGTRRGHEVCVGTRRGHAIGGVCGHSPRSCLRRCVWALAEIGGVCGH